MNNDLDIYNITIFKAMWNLYFLCNIPRRQKWDFCMHFTTTSTQLHCDMNFLIHKIIVHSSKPVKWKIKKSSLINVKMIIIIQNITNISLYKKPNKKIYIEVDNWRLNWTSAHLDSWSVLHQTRTYIYIENSVKSKMTPLFWSRKNAENPKKINWHHIHSQLLQEKKKKALFSSSFPNAHSNI